MKFWIGFVSGAVVIIAVVVMAVYNVRGEL